VNNIGYFYIFKKDKKFGNLLFKMFRTYPLGLPT